MEQTEKEEETPYRIIKNDDTNIITIYLYGEIGMPIDMVDIIETIENAAEHQTVHLKIASEGGYIDGAEVLIDAMKRSPAYIVGQIAGPVMSAATLIALMCDDLEISPYSSFMTHAPSYGSEGKQHEVYSSVEFNTTKLRRLFEDVYQYFLTPKEIKKVFQGHDIYLEADEVRGRWQNVLINRTKDRLKETLKVHKKELKTLEETTELTIRKIKDIEKQIKGK